MAGQPPRPQLSPAAPAPPRVLLGRRRRTRRRRGGGGGRRSASSRATSRRLTPPPMHDLASIPSRLTPSPLSLPSCCRPQSSPLDVAAEPDGTLAGAARFFRAAFPPEVPPQVRALGAPPPLCLPPVPSTRQPGRPKPRSAAPALAPHAVSVPVRARGGAGWKGFIAWRWRPEWPATFEALRGGGRPFVPPILQARPLPAPLLPPSLPRAKPAPRAAAYIPLIPPPPAPS